MGGAVCLVIIFQCEDKTVPRTWKTGIDPTVNHIRTGPKNQIDFELNKGKGKFYPRGPTCEYNGKTVHCLSLCSKSGGITGEILVDILAYFDEIDLFPRVEGGSIPMLIVDGHQSCLHPKFIHYINNEGHEWSVCFGVSYATVLWQVGDASEQNRKFKTEWYRGKNI